MKTCDMKLRLPHDLKAMLKDRAEANNRKMNGEVIAILERAFSAKRKTA